MSEKEYSSRLNASNSVIETDKLLRHQRRERLGYSRYRSPQLHCKNVWIISTHFWLPELHRTIDDLQLRCPNWVKVTQSFLQCSNRLRWSCARWCVASVSSDVPLSAAVYIYRGRGGLGFNCTTISSAPMTLLEHGR